MPFERAENSRLAQTVLRSGSLAGVESQALALVPVVILRANNPNELPLSCISLSLAPFPAPCPTPAGEQRRSPRRLGRRAVHPGRSRYESSRGG